MPTPIENDPPASTSTPLTAQPNVEQTLPTPPTLTSQPPELTYFVMPGTFNDDDQITSIVDSKVQPPSLASPPPQSSTSSSLSESSTQKVHIIPSMILIFLHLLAKSLMIKIYGGAHMVIHFQLQFANLMPNTNS